MNSEQEIIEFLKKNPLIAVVAIPDPSFAVPLARSLLNGGIKCIEITFRNKNAFDSLKSIKDAGLDILYGAGTVRTIEDAKFAIEAGVKFIVSPGFNEKVINFVQENSSIPFFPGVDSTLGIEKSVQLGIKNVKFFPANASGGLKWISAMKGPYFDINFMPTGGIGLKNLAEYLSLPNVIACGGSFIAPSNLIKNKEWDQITSLAQEAMKIVYSIKN